MKRKAKTLRPERVSTAIRFPADIYEDLRQAAVERDLSMNYLVVKAVEDFLARLVPADEMKLTK